MNPPNLLWRERQSDSVLIESVWTCTAIKDVKRPVIADPCLSISVIKRNEYAEVRIMGPKTRPRQQLLPSGSTCVTIRLKPGVFLKSIATNKLIDTSISIVAPNAIFRLEGESFHFPDFKKAEELVRQLYASGQIGFRLPLITQSSQAYARQLKEITGLTPYRLYQLRRMHRALRMLKQGMPATDVAIELTFTDQAHLINTSRRFFGRTPGQLLNMPQSP